jgi:hypothetical protein
VGDDALFRRLTESPPLEPGQRTLPDALSWLRN